ncbi:hypothetical protein FKP32DRAFT_1741497, partial [Trametes sanguinea]
TIRLFLHHSSVHSGILAGIAGSKHEGCYSVRHSSEPFDRVIYTGCGGRDTKDGEKPREGPQTCDQSWENSRNMSLKVSAHTKKPVRVVRGYKSSSDFAPAQGYRYDGLYVVEKAWMDVGKSGYQVCKFSFKVCPSTPGSPGDWTQGDPLQRLPDQPPIPRRQGTLNLDLSEWERPRHFGKKEEASETRVKSYSRRSKDPETTSSEAAVDDVEMADEEKASASPEKRAPSLPASKPPTMKPLPLEPIPPTSNIASRRASVPTAPASASQAPSVDVHALLAEWSGSGINARR